MIRKVWNLLKTMLFIFNFGLDLICFLFLFSFFGMIYRNAFLVSFEKDSRIVSYNQLPTNIKYMIYEFELECYKRRIDISKVRKIKYILVNSPKIDWGGYSGYFFIALNLYNQDENSLKHNIWHELGHRILRYGHDERENTSHIMNSGRSKQIYISWEDQKKQFFNERIDLISFNQYKHALIKNNYAYYFAKEKILTIWNYIQLKLKDKSLNTLYSKN